MKYLIILLALITLLRANPLAAKTNDTVQGHKKPEICMRSNIRCILKQFHDGKYWCLKSNIQRNLDARRTSRPIRKTHKGNLGNCAKIIKIK